MNKCIRKFVRCSIIVLIGVGCFDLEGRLPKYQGETAATILVNTVWPEGGPIGTYGTRQELINDLAAIIYTNEGRQSLANWMCDRRPAGIYGRGKPSILHIAAGDRFLTGSRFYLVLQKILNAALDNEETNAKFSQLVNLAFPCWTGTLTCYMHNNGQSLAKEALQVGSQTVVNACKWFLGIGGINTDRLPANIRAKAGVKDELITDHSDLIKFIGILFTLELIDDWRQLQDIVGVVAAGTEPLLAAGYTSPMVVPIPNTCYNTRGRFLLDCHLSTLKNLLAILCNGNFASIRNARTQAYFTRKQEQVAFLEHIARSTSRAEHSTWFEVLPENVKDSAEPSIQWLAYALDVLHRDSGHLTFANWKANIIGTGEGSIQASIREITANPAATVRITQIVREANWISHQIAIIIPGRVEITIKGKLQEGSHIEITDIIDITI